MRRRAPVVVAPPRRGPNLLGTMAQTAVIAGTATVVSKSVSGAMNSSAQNKQAAAQQAADQQAAAQQAQIDAAVAEQVAAQQAAAPAAPAAPAGPEPGSLDFMAGEIQKLQVMKDQGLITQEEFDAKKKQILGI